MPYIRSDEDGFDVDDDDNVTYTGDFQYCTAAEYAYKPHAFAPADLSPLAAGMFAALKSLGVVTFRVRYDGGHDEGFAHADAAALADGTSLPLDDLVARLGTRERVADLRRAGATPVSGQRYNAGDYYSGLSDADLVRHALDELGDEIAGALLGDGFGTGEYSMYGALVADLLTGEITDDPAAPKPPDSTFE